MISFIVILIITVVYLVALTQIEVKTVRGDASGELDIRFPAVETSVKLLFFFAFLAVTLFLYYFTGGILGNIVLIPLLLFMFVLCS